MSHDEHQAIASLREGDIGGLEFLVREYQLKATRAAYLVTGNRQTAEDVVQAAFLRVYERIHQFDRDRPFEPWFLRIVLNDARKAVSRVPRFLAWDQRVNDEGATLADILRDPDLGPDALAERAELRATVEKALAQLSPAQRAGIVARYYLNLSGAEFARRTGRSSGTVKWLLHAARGRLRTLLGGP